MEKLALLWSCRVRKHLGHIDDKDLIEKIKVLAGIRDNSLVLFGINMSPKTQKKPPRIIYMCEKADEENIKEIFQRPSQEYFTSPPQQRTVKENQSFFEATVKDLLSIIPSDSKWETQPPLYYL